MKKVITYGTYDLLHHGHIRLLERAKALGDYLIVGVTSDSFDRSRGKNNVNQTLAERIESVKATGLADQIIIEEYEGQKIDDIVRYGVDVFTVGSDWIGKFDYLKNYCRVIYLDRTSGISSSDIRSSALNLKIGFAGSSKIIAKYMKESRNVNGLVFAGIVNDSPKHAEICKEYGCKEYGTYEEMIDSGDCEAVYIVTPPDLHYEYAKKALTNGLHVLCESPITTDTDKAEELRTLAENNNLILFESIKTAYALAYRRLISLAKSNIVGKIVSVRSACTSLDRESDQYSWDSIGSWGPTALLPVFQILGTDYLKRTISAIISENGEKYTKIDFYYDDAVASVEVANNVKTEGTLIVSGTEGYIYVPAPWWKTDYFEVRYENSDNNKRYYYKLEGEGITDLIVMFLGIIKGHCSQGYVDIDTSDAISSIVGDVKNNKIDNIIASSDR